MLINEENTDIILINPEGEIIFDDIGNYRYFQLGMESARGKNLRDLYVNLNEDYPLFKAAREGTATENFEINLTTRRGIELKKIGSCYPIYDGSELAGAVEFGRFYYDKDHVGEIEQHSEHVLYRKNNTKYLLDDIITQDPAMLEIKGQIEKIALSDSNVLIFGKTGTGKELVAQAIHNSSRRYGKKFLSQNCSAIPDNLLESILFGTTKGSFTGAFDRTGLFEEADGGTVFLDEINSLNPDMQVKLLKAIESKKIRRIGSDKEVALDFRVVAATNEEPGRLLAEKRMKPDLLYRLAVVFIKLPDLADRKGDIELLVSHFINYFNEKTNSSVGYPDKEIMDIFKRYSWPGNVRELRNVIEGAFAFAEDNQIKKNDIPSYILENVASGVKPQKEEGLQKEMDNMERKLVLSAYEANGRKLTETAEFLKISKQLLRYKLNRYEETDR